MMAGGIVMVSLTPIALLAALVANNQQNACETGGIYFDGSGTVTEHNDCGAYDKTIYGGLIVGVALLGAWLFALAADHDHRDAGAEARISPWASPEGAGLSLRLDM
jgi:hypothetical protein